MEVRVLEYFLAVAREGSVTGAAAVLHVSQPTLSRQIIDLERELGTTLFERSRNGIALTEDGMLLRRRAAEIVGLVWRTEDEVMRSRGVIAGEIRIGCAETRAMDLMASVMRDLRAKHPGVIFRVQSVVAEDAVERIERGLLDFGLLVRPSRRSDLGAIKLPTRERVGLIVPEDDPLACRDRLALADLVGLPLLVPESYRESEMLGGEVAKADGGRLDVVGTFTLSYNAARMVAAGVGYAVSLAGIVGVGPGTGLAFVPLDVDLDMPSYLVWKARAHRSRACDAFLERAQAAWAHEG